MTGTLQKLLLSVEPELRACDEVQLYNATMLFMFRGLNYKAYSARLTKLLGKKPNVRAITEALGCNGYLLKNYKTWVFYVVKHKLNHHDAMVYSRKWKVEHIDAAWFIHLGVVTLSYIKRLAKKYAALTLEKFDRILNGIMSDPMLKTWLGKFTSKKHRFVATSQSMTLDHIRSDLACNGMQGLLNMYPLVKSRLHALNIVKRTIHNTGINMIHHYTSQKTGRIVKNMDGSFEAKIVSFESIRETLELQAVEHDDDLRVDFTRLIEEAKEKPKKVKFIELLAGNYCPKFTAWLREHGHRVDTNEALQEKVDTKTYVQKCLEFIGIKPKTVWTFLAKLKEQFTPYRNGRTFA